MVRVRTYKIGANTHINSDIGSQINFTGELANKYVKTKIDFKIDGDKLRFFKATLPSGPGILVPPAAVLSPLRIIGHGCAPGGAKDNPQSM